jgi:hypothetical protein
MTERPYVWEIGERDAAMRVVWITAGWVSFGLGVLGAMLPLMPTVVFMLLAAFCFSRGSPRLHDWLMSHPRFGAAIVDWRDAGMIRPAAKRAALMAICLSFGISAAVGVPGSIMLIQAVVLSSVIAFILSRPGGSLWERSDVVSPLRRRA